jgi:hypothetical protein
VRKTLPPGFCAPSVKIGKMGGCAAGRAAGASGLAAVRPLTGRKLRVAKERMAVVQRDGNIAYMRSHVERGFWAGREN